MNTDIIESYVEKVYGYAINHTYSQEEANELSQEILFTAIRELPKLKDESKFEPWLWGIANNVNKVFRRSMGKQRGMYSYDILANMGYEDAELNAVENEELFALLRAKISMLSSIYRNIIILYYYDDLSTKQISEKLKIPEGTVTWRLSEARKKLKKECENMNETALRPVRMSLDIYGSGMYGFNNIPFPSEYINDSLSQNILYYCYDKAKTIEELSKLCGVPAYYVEERVENLIKRNAVIMPAKGKYQTDFIIWSDKYGIYCEKYAETALLPVADKMIAALKALAKDASGIRFYKAGKSENELFYLYGVMAFAYLSRHYCELPYPPIQPNYDGFQWRYIANMESGAHHRIGISTQQNENAGSRGTYSHTVYCCAGFRFRKMMYDYYINVCEDLLTAGKTEDEFSAAAAISEGYIIKKDNGEFFVTVPSFTKKQKSEFDALVEKHLSALMPEYSNIVNHFVEGYKLLFPRHLSEDADRMSQSFFLGFYEYFVLYGQKNHLLMKPEADYVCDVMIQHK